MAKKISEYYPQGELVASELVNPDGDVILDTVAQTLEADVIDDMDNVLIDISEGEANLDVTGDLTGDVTGDIASAGTSTFADIDGTDADFAGDVTFTAGATIDFENVEVKNLSISAEPANTNDSADEPDSFKFWSGTQAQYDALDPDATPPGAGYDTSTLYFIH